MDENQMISILQLINMALQNPQSQKQPTQRFLKAKKARRIILKESFWALMEILRGEKNCAKCGEHE